MLLLYDRLTPEVSRKALDRHRRARRRENRIMIYFEEGKVKTSRREEMGGASQREDLSVCSDSANHMTVGSTPSASFM